MMKSSNKLLTFLLVFFLLTCQKELLLSKSIDNKVVKNKAYNLSSLEWKLWGYRPENWKMDFNFDELTGPKAEYINIPVKVPGSVQGALKDAAIIEDWNIGTNYVKMEWIENRHWIYCTRIPDDWISKGSHIILNCLGLDDNGVVMVNGKEVGKFCNTFISYQFDVTPFLKEKNNTLAIVFECPPSYLGQIGYTSKIKDWKPRFYYGWDWIPRIVQIGIWDDIFLEVPEKEGVIMEELKIVTETDKNRDLANLKVSAGLSPRAFHGKVRIKLTRDTGESIIDETIPATQLRDGKEWNNLAVKRWWPNGSGEQVLYKLECVLLDSAGNKLQVISRNVGFKRIEWQPCKGAGPEAVPWLCSINNKPVFLQGVNWTPVRPNFADLRESDYHKWIKTYKDLGINIFRVWGGGFPEKDWFYDICDEMGIMLWQEFPLSSSGLDNYPPDSPEEIAVMLEISEGYVKRLRHHVSLLLWCGGNELYKSGDIAPIDDNHPMIHGMKEIVLANDPGRRFVPASPSGPTIYSESGNFGNRKSWDVHGPWKLPFTDSDHTMNAVRNFWTLDDALIHSEVGVPGGMSADMINKYRGEYPAQPANMSNVLWRQVSSWIEWGDFLDDHKGAVPGSLEEYVSWSQERQTSGLSIALKANKSRFPACGGFIIWMGHDSYPCPVNTSIIDFDGNLKPSAITLSQIWKGER